MNAGIKFARFHENYRPETLHSSMAEIANQTLDIVDLIYKRITPSEAFLARETSTRRGVNYSGDGGIDMNDHGGDNAGPSGIQNEQRRLLP
jgi:hypothetical protein